MVFISFFILFFFKHAKCIYVKKSKSTVCARKQLNLFTCRRRYEERDERRFRRGGGNGGEMRGPNNRESKLIHAKNRYYIYIQNLTSKVKASI